MRRLDVLVDEASAVRLAQSRRKTDREPQEKAQIHRRFGGTRGTVMRTEGMFAGATMEDVEGDYGQRDVTGVFRSAKQSIKHGFNRAQEEARGMFEKVKRSFSDFINRE